VPFLAAVAPPRPRPQRHFRPRTQNPGTGPHTPPVLEYSPRTKFSKSIEGEKFFWNLDFGLQNLYILRKCKPKGKGVIAVSMGDRLKMARVRAGLSLRGLAERVEVSPMAISKYERGVVVPGSAMLVKMSDVLKVKPDYFFRPTKVTVSSPEFRKKQSLSAKSRKMIMGEVQEWLERYLEVESLLFEEPPRFQMPEGFPRRISSIEEAESVAEALRKEWGLGEDPIENLSEVLEEHNLKVGLVEGGEGFDALTLWSDHESPVIVIKRGLPGDRHRLNLAHELGHNLIVDEESVDAEKAAFRFAGALLVPAKAARWELGYQRRHLDYFELHSLKHKYGMSMQAWIYRAKDLNIITEYVAVQQFRHFRQRGWYHQEPGDQLPPEKPGRMKRLVMQALVENQISRSRAGELLGKPLAEFWKEEAAEHEGFPEASYS
jgi:Zn-dependent peptidase ImmA (M78 family)/DNA-binding XRE family transcriptional regulator